ncbi:hypothetical protein LCGC14_2985330 [marine sediment metagenome]|uniref:Uncharacterized protein n=1 Tax=marine sediment metagenome TaxID=412755 RepID=A0A0F8ZWJ5_9ZZZZ
MGIVGNAPKQPAETFPITVDFEKDLDAAQSETLSLAVVTSKNEATGVDSSSTLLSGAPSVSGSKATQQIKAGADGEDHLVQFRATTNLANVFEAEVRVLVRET